MTIPKSFNDFTVKQFQEWHRITNNYVGEQREYRLLGSLIDKTYEQVRDMTFQELDPLLDQIDAIDKTINKKVKSIVIVNKNVYVAITNPKQLKELMTANQFTAAKTYSETTDKSIENMDKLLALMFSPYKLFHKPKLADNQAWLAEQFQSAKIGHVYGAVFFYSVVWTKSQPILAPYFDHANKVLTEHLQKDLGLDLQNLTDGITQ